MHLKIKKDGASRGKIKLVRNTQGDWVAYTESSKVYKDLHGKSEYEVQMWLVMNGFKYETVYRN